MSKQAIRLSIVIPAYAEERLIDATLTELEFYLMGKDIKSTTEVVVVAADGGDDTARIARLHAANFEHFNLIEPGQRVGKGRDVAFGLRQARGEYRIFTDADLATPLSHVEYMVELLESGNEVVIGMRDTSKVHETLLRRISSKLSNTLIQVMVAPAISDTQCGFKGFTAEAAERIFSQTTIMGWGFDFEVIAMARKFKYRIGKIDIDDWRDPKGDHGLVGDSQIGAMISTLKELFIVRLNLWKGMYK